jgi:epoxide hydrolase-like predicted phosphatase
MTKIKFIYFDLGGVFFHWRRGLKILAERFQKDYEELEGIRIKYDDMVCKGKITTEELWGKYKEELGIITPENFNFAEEWVKTFTKIPESHELVKELLQIYPIGILTNVYPEVYDLQIKYGLVPDLNYQVVVRSDQLGIVKPDPEIFNIAQQKAGVKPEEILYTDDQQSNVEAAGKLGWNVVWFEENNPEKSIKEIKKILRFTQDDI